jgi:hypothetical protein
MRMSAQSLSQLALSEAVEREIISTICDWERLSYGEGKHRTTDAFHDCAKKNRTGFFILWVQNTLLGYADVWELPVEFYSRLRVGTIDEESIAASCILGESDPRSSLWYIGSIIIDPEVRRARPVAGAIAFASICNALPTFFQAHSHFPAKILGVGSSPFGKKLLTRWGFSPVANDPNAIDLRPRFEKSMSAPTDADDLYLGRREASQETPSK